MKKLSTFFAVILATASLSAVMWGQTTYTSTATGNWSTMTWSPAGTPGTSDSVVIASPHVVTLDVAATVKSCTVLGTLDASTHGLSLDFTDGTLALQSGSTFKQGTGTTLPGTTQSFALTSTYVFNGGQTSLPAGATYGNLIWSSTSNASVGANLTVNGDLTLLNCKDLTANSGPKTHTVGGNVVINGTNTTTPALVGTTGTATGTWNISGSVTTENGGILRGGPNTATGNSVFNVGGDLTNNGSVECITGGTFTLSFNGSSTQHVTGNPLTKDALTADRLQHVTINNSAGVVLQTDVIIPGTLTLTSGALSTSATLTLENGANIVRNGGSLAAPPTIAGSDQIGVTYTGSVTTGNELPTSLNGLGNLTINNASGVTLGASPIVNGTLTMTSGNIALNGKNLTIGQSAGSTGTLSWTSGFLTGSGSFVRWFGTSAITLGTAAGQFPFGVGSNNRSVWIAGSPSTGGTVTVQYGDATGATQPFGAGFTENGSNFLNRSNASWTVVAANSFAGSGLSLRIQGSGLSSVNNTSDLNLSGPTAAAPGAYSAATGTTTDPQVNRTGLAGTDLAGAFYFASTSGSPLPVELTSFTASERSGKIELAWATATEINNYGFEIERKTVNNEQSTINNWAKIGFVEGHGTTNAPQNYSFTDAAARVGKYSYRLKQIDRDGKFEYNKAVEVTIGVTPNTVWLDNNYPNPFNPVTRISFVLGTTGHASLKVYDLLGAEVATLANGVFNAGELQEFAFDASKLSSGVYYYQLKSGERTEMKKMLLLK